jgi:ATP-binding cassette subfamily F protein uup
LSGGERNRLLLARLFTRPANVLVLDEPTNDLDIETLELLEQLLTDFAGTILLVSHDRQFLNNVVTSTIAFEGDGIATENVGDYDTWKELQRFKVAEFQSVKVSEFQSSSNSETLKPWNSETLQRKKLSYKEQREFEALPARIEELEGEERALNARIASPEFYKETADAIKTTLARVETLKAELETAYARWAELEERTG